MSITFLLVLATTIFLRPGRVISLEFEITVPKRPLSLFMGCCTYIELASFGQKNIGLALDAKEVFLFFFSFGEICWCIRLHLDFDVNFFII
jgi:hypothetical protein